MSSYFINDIPDALFLFLFIGHKLAEVGKYYNK